MSLWREPTKVVTLKRDNGIDDSTMRIGSSKRWCLISLGFVRFGWLSAVGTHKRKDIETKAKARVESRKC